eukprot:5974468-Alexandrium_andersonii.AAC.1
MAADCDKADDVLDGDDAPYGSSDDLLGFSLEQSRGTGILDCGASRSAGGLTELEAVQKLYHEAGLALE